MRPLALACFLAAAAAVDAAAGGNGCDEYRTQLLNRSQPACDSAEDLNACVITRGLLADIDSGRAECMPTGATHRYAYTKAEHDALNDFAKVTVEKNKTQQKSL
jgi:hypothetical protein